VKYFTSDVRDNAGAPGIANAMMDVFAIAHGRISRSRLADDPPEVVVNARLEQPVSRRRADHPFYSRRHDRARST
jgi:hypothetical protein